MGYAAITIAILGATGGLVFRVKVLLLIVALLLLLSITFSAASGFTFLQTTLTIVVAQTILQSTYFLGLLFRSVMDAAHRMRPVL